MDVSIIIINYRCAQLINDCLRSLYSTTKGVTFEIIIVDNDPDNGEKELVISQFPGVNWIDMPYNAGFGRANNAGMNAANGRYHLLLNADTLLTDDSISKCVQYLDAEPSLIAGGAMQTERNGTLRPFFKSFNELLRSFFILPQHGIIGSVLHKLFPDPVYPDSRQYDWLVGAFLMVRREGFDKTKGFEESLFMYGEDVEWCWRLGKLGKLCYFKDCTFIHLENENPFRRTRITWINRFSIQMQISNMVWVRKQYGILIYTMILLHYLTMLPIVYTWRTLANLKNGELINGGYETQHILAKKVMVLCKYYGKTINYSKYFFKLKPEENIDKLYA